MGNKPNPDTVSLAFNEEEQPFEDLPELFGPLNGYYYHIKDKKKAIDNDKNNTNHKIPYIFKYNATDFEAIQKPQPNDNRNDDENKDNKDDDNIDLESLKEYQQSRFEWVYIKVDDNAPYRKINDSNNSDYSLSNGYDTIINYLATHDPIPPYFLRKARMADIVFKGVEETSLCKMKQLKCRIITKNVGEKMNIRHPALLIWDKKKEFTDYNDSSYIIIHLIKLPVQYLSEHEKQQKKEQVEIECKPIFGGDLKKNKWDYKSYKEQDLNLEKGLIDIAHWCLKYEMEQNYQYKKYTRNCKEFMMRLCNQFKIDYDAKNWEEIVMYVAIKAGKFKQFHIFQ